MLFVLVISGAFQDLSGLHTPVLLTQRETAPSDAESPLEIETFVQELERPQQPTREEEQRKKEETATKMNGQVVDIARPALEQRPDEARFLSEYDSTVTKESKGTTSRGQAGIKVASEPTPQQPGQPEPPTTPARPGPLAMRLPRLDAPRLDSNDTTVKEFGPDGTIHNRTRALPTPSRQGGGGRNQGKSQPNLLGTPEVLQKALGLGAGSMDYLGDMEEAESTALNAKKWKFATFFNRLKRAVADEWHPDTVYLRHDPSGNIYGVKDRETVLRVHLKADGKLADLQLLRSSGVEFLDDEAMSAFKRAQPFQNPPSQLVEADGQIHFNFAFIFELSGHTRFQYRRY